MTPPVLLAIVLNLQAAVQAISRSGGYNYDIKASSVTTEPTNLETVDVLDAPFVILGHRIEALGRDYKTTRPIAIQDRWRITLEAVVDPVSADPVGKITAFSNFTADLEKALIADLQRGGLALITYVQQPIPWMGLASQTRVYLEQPVDVLLQRNLGAP